MGCIKVKCPYAKRNSTLKEAAKDKIFSFKKKIMAFSSNTATSTITSARGVVNILELPWIDFVVYTQSDLHIERIFRETALWNERINQTYLLII